MTRRVLGLALCVVFALALLGAAVILSGAPRAVAGTPVQTWALVDVPCPSGQVGVGHGCYNPAGAVDAAHWSVSAGSATWTQPTFVTSYTWSMPATASQSDTFASGAGQVVLGTRATDNTNNSGVDTQVCLTGPFPYTWKGNPGGYPNCANAAAPTPGTSNTGSNTILLLPGGTSPSALCPDGKFECVVEEIGLGDGGHVDFTYERMEGELHTVRYAFHGVYSGRRRDVFKSIGVSGRGTFQIEGTPRGRAYVKTLNPSGLAALKATEAKGSPATIRMRAASIQFYAPNVLHIVYEVTAQSHFGGCEPVHKRKRFTVIQYASHRGGGLDFDICTTGSGHWVKDSAQVSIQIR